MSRLKAGSEHIPDPASQFDCIAFLYDDLMAGVPYAAWVAYLHRILKRFNHKPQTILDLCCGTGRVSLILASQGYLVTGVDISPAMIEKAKLNAVAQNQNVDFHVQDASRLHLGRRFDLIVSFFDSLNYILDSSVLQEVFYRISEHLEPGGFFVFDMNTELALAKGMFNQSNMGSKADTLYHWRSSYDTVSHLCRIHMNFIQRKSDSERRVEVVHYQRAYESEDLSHMLESADLKVLAIYDAYTFCPPGHKSDRIFFVAASQKHTPAK